MWPPLRLAWNLLVLAVLYTEPVPAQERTVLPAPPEELLASPTRIVLQLPDTGGVTINHQPISWQRLAAELRAIYAMRPVKVLLVEAGPQRTREELEHVRQLAEKQGIRVYAANREGIRR